MIVRKHTKGPWQWCIRTDGEIYLATPHSGHLIVMDFVRRGMQGGQPRFATWKGDERENMGGIMVPATQMNVSQNPDAKLIEAAPELYAGCWLIAVLCEEDGKPVDGFRFREAVAMCRAAVLKVSGQS